MFGTRQLRAAALGFGLAFLISPPDPHGSIDRPDRYQALMSYPLVIIPAIPATPEVICGEGEYIDTLHAEGEYVDTLTAVVTYKLDC